MFVKALNQSYCAFSPTKWSMIKATIIGGGYRIKLVGTYIVNSHWQSVQYLDNVH